MRNVIRTKAENNQSVVACTYNGVDYEGFRLYEGESDLVNIRKLNGPARYALCVAIASEGKDTHYVFIVIDTNHHIQTFANFMSKHFPKVNYIRYLRSRT